MKKKKILVMLLKLSLLKKMTRILTYIYKKRKEFLETYYKEHSNKGIEVAKINVIDDIENQILYLTHEDVKTKIKHTVIQGDEKYLVSIRNKQNRRHYVIIQSFEKKDIAMEFKEKLQKIIDSKVLYFVVEEIVCIDEVEEDDE